MPRRIAIVGSGISSCAAATHLQAHADLTIFERSPFVGGHGYTAHVEVEGREIDLDVGVQIIRPDIAPTVFALLESDPAFASLGVTEVPVSIVSVSEREGRALHYSNLPEYQTQAPFDADWTRFGPECARFEALTSTVDNVRCMTQVGEWALARGFDQDFLDGVLVPSMSIVNVTRNGLLDGLFVTNLEPPSAVMGLCEPRIWFRFNELVEGFRAVYLRGLEGCFELGKEVITAQRNVGGGVYVRVRDLAGHVDVREFDELIWGGDLVSARAALDHDDNPDRAAHMQALQTFATEPALVYIHRDARWIPSELPHRASAVFEAREGTRRMHYNATVIQDLPLDAPLWVSLCHERPAREPAGLVHDPIAWTHPQNSPAIFAAQRELHRVQGLGDIWYCGSGTIVDGFDGCLVSGIEIASRIEPSVSFPFMNPVTEQQKTAKQDYQTLIETWMFPEIERPT